MSPPDCLEGLRLFKPSYYMYIKSPFSVSSPPHCWSQRVVYKEAPVKRVLFSKYIPNRHLILVATYIFLPSALLQHKLYHRVSNEVRLNVVFNRIGFSTHLDDRVLNFRTRLSRDNTQN